MSDNEESIENSRDSQSESDQAAASESVWEYPRPPRIEPCKKKIEIFHMGVPVAVSNRSLRVLETSHPPVYYIPKDDVDMSLLVASADHSYCEFKGQAHYFDLDFAEMHTPKVAWGYHRPLPDFAALTDHLAFYASRVEECRVNGEIVLAQPGDFYGGWITSAIRGPFKGSPGTRGW